MLATADNIAAARAKLKEKFVESGHQIGGKGTARRKTKKVFKSNVGDERKVQQVLKRLNVPAIPDIEEVRMYQDDGKILCFDKPKVQAAPSSNTYVVSGSFEEKPIDDVQNLVKDLASKGVSARNEQFKNYLLQQMKSEMPDADLKLLEARLNAMAMTEDIPGMVSNFEAVSKEE